MLPPPQREVASCPVSLGQLGGGGKCPPCGLWLLIGSVHLPWQGQAAPPAPKQKPVVEGDVLPQEKPLNRWVQPDQASSMPGQKSPQYSQWEAPPLQSQGMNLQQITAEPKTKATLVPIPLQHPLASHRPLGPAWCKKARVILLAQA